MSKRNPERVEVRRDPTDLSEKVKWGAIAGQGVVVFEWILSSSFDWRAALAVAVAALAAYAKRDTRRSPLGDGAARL